MADLRANVSRPSTLSQVMSRVIALSMKTDKGVVFAGQDITPGGHYGVGIQSSGDNLATQVWNTLIDEPWLGGLLEGLPFSGVKPWVELSYRAYSKQGTEGSMYELAVRKALSAQTRADTGAILRMPTNGLVVGGPTHTENSFPELMIPGIPLFCASSALMAGVGALAALTLVNSGETVVFLEPTSLYARSDLFEEKDGEWRFFPPSFELDYDPRVDVAVYQLADAGSSRAVSVSINGQELVEGTSASQKPDLVIATYGDGVVMAIEAAKELEKEGRVVKVVDYASLRPSDPLFESFEDLPVVLADPARPGGAPGERVLSEFVQRGMENPIRHVLSDYTLNPSGPAQREVYLSVERIVTEAREVLG